ncbi:MAG: DNA mismatch repair protein MutS [bacterium]|nr:DNA mismatch repair protein MutS [bacterium]
MAKSRTTTPMMQQYRALKEQAGDAVLLFRMGDFYELFAEDAERVAPILDLVLTTRDKDTTNPVPMCGMPFHAVEGYIRKLLAAGHSVAIGEQTEDPKQAKGLVRREIVEVVTPGLVASNERLDGSGANYLAAVLCEEGRYGLAYLDVSTGEFCATETERREVFEAELDRVSAREIVARSSEKSLVTRAPVRATSSLDFDPESVAKRVGRLPEGLDEDATDVAARAAAALWSTVASLQPAALDQLTGLRFYTAADTLLLDASTRRHLELFQNLQDGGKRGTVFELLDRTRTPMGRRRLANWIGEPLIQLSRIRERQERIRSWMEPDSRRQALSEALRGVGDLERRLTRVGLPGTSPRDVAALRESLSGVGRVHEVEALSNPLTEICAELERVLVDEPPNPPRGEPYIGYIRDGVDDQVDQIRSEGEEGNAYFADLELRERERTGIQTLRVKYNRVFGYSIEVGKAKADLVPEEYRRKQTTANAERFTTDELERWEGVVLRGRERAAAAESRVLQQTRGFVGERVELARGVAREIADLDVVHSLAQVARERDYVCPEVDDSLRIEVEGARHPVVETFVRDGFIANDLIMDADPNDTEAGRSIILTGPNMAGKSTLLRQVGLLVLLAQMGAFVPARRARIGLADRIFTRVGASDSLATGESTFMVEMRETATILKEGSARSLVLLDEIGRGTSTFDGLSIAWAVAEYLHDSPGLRCRVIFATHYHELADLARTKSGVRNFHFSCVERDGEILFLRHMESGAASRSYGIEVARYAGLPPQVIRRAREILANLEGGEFDESGTPRLARGPGERPPAQLGLFSTGTPESDAVREALRALDPERMTPIEAIVELQRLKQLIEEKG